MNDAVGFHGAGVRPAIDRTESYFCIVRAADALDYASTPPPGQASSMPCSSRTGEPYVRRLASHHFHIPR